MKPITATIITGVAACLIVACVAFESRLSRVTSPDFSAAAITAGCTGGREFIEAATSALDPAAATLIVKGVAAACALRAGRKPISTTIYDDPLDSFCAEADPLTEDDATIQVRTQFNQRLAETCEVRR